MFMDVDVGREELEEVLFLRSRLCQEVGGATTLSFDYVVSYVL
jgi:hypothetical protein